MLTLFANQDCADRGPQLVRELRDMPAAEREPRGPGAESAAPFEQLQRHAPALQLAVHARPEPALQMIDAGAELGLCRQHHFCRR